LASVFFVFAIIQLYAAFRIDVLYEDEELLLIKSMPEALDLAADRVGLQPIEKPNSDELTTG
jgi:hypothetical protein